MQIAPSLQAGGTSPGMRLDMFYARLFNAIEGRSDHLDSESGVAMAVFGLWIVVLFGFGALAIDVSRIYTEHSELRNGADAAALAIARDCGQGLCDGFYDEYGMAETYADANARDGATWVEDVEIDFGEQAVTVSVGSEDDSGGNTFDMVLAGIIGFNGLTVRTDATVKWGAPAGFTAFPVTFSKCEWDEFGAPGFVDENPDGHLHRQASVLNDDIADSSSYAYADKSVTIYLHGTSVCGGSPSGGDIPGGFGWLDADSGCQLTTSQGTLLAVDPGASPSSGCSPTTLEDVLGTVQVIPYFNDVTGTGNNAIYHMDGFGALYVTGYNLGGLYKEKSLIDGQPVCTGSLRCIQGYLIGDWIQSGASTGLGGTQYGVVALELTN